MLSVDDGLLPVHLPGAVAPPLPPPETVMLRTLGGPGRQRAVRGLLALNSLTRPKMVFALPEC